MVSENQMIHVHLNSKLHKVDGELGGFKSTISENGESTTVESGVIVVAAGDVAPHALGALLGRALGSGLAGDLGGEGVGEPDTALLDADVADKEQHGR